MRRLVVLIFLAAALVTASVAPVAAASTQEDYELKIGPKAHITAVTPDVTHLAVSVSYKCPSGQTIDLQILVNQGDNFGFGPLSGATCTGKFVNATVDVQTNFGSGDTFTPGVADAEGRLFVNFQQVLTTTRQIRIS